MSMLAVSPLVLADDVDVHVKGIDDPLKENVHKSLELTSKHDEPWSADHIRRLYRLAPREIKQALQPYGYFNPTFQQKLEAPSGDSKTWQATFTIDHGPATKITHLHIAAEGPGADLNAVQKALHETHLKKGKRLVESRYTDTKNALHDAAFNAGYLDAKFSQSTIRVNPRSNSAQIDLVLNTGERYYFGPVTFEQHLLNDKFLHKYVPFSQGDPYNSEKLVNLQVALSESNYFQQIDISAPRDKAVRTSGLDPWFYDLMFPAPSAPEGHGKLEIPVTVKASPSKSQSYNISAGYGTDTGPRIGFGVLFRHINQYGHQFRTNLRLSQIERTLHASYDIPIADVTQDKLSFTGTISNQEYGDITSTMYGVGVIRDTTWKHGHNRLYLKLEREYYDLGHGTRHSTLLYPGYTFTYKKADSLLFTHKGVSFSLDVRGGSDLLGSSANFLRTDASANAVVPMLPKTRLVLHSQFGAIETNDFGSIPPSQRFYAGGSQSVRGYAYQTISPTNYKNEDIGGRYLVSGTIEGDWFFYKKFGLAAFLDAGDVANSLTDISLKKGVGIGFRWGSPVGMVRFDIAHPLDGPHDGIRLHFSLGPDL